MPIKSTEYDHFIYILYTRKSNVDIKHLKHAIETYTKNYKGQKDFIIDLTPCKELTSLELGIIAKALTRVVGSKRYLRLVATGAVLDLLETSGLLDKKFVVLYKSTQDFISELKRFQQQKDLSVLSDGEKVEEIVLSGALEGKKVKEMTDLVNHALTKTCKRIVLNMKGVKLLDSLTLGQLMYLDGRAKDLNKSIILLAPQEHIMELFRDTSLDKMFEITPAV